MVAMITMLTVLSNAVFAVGLGISCLEVLGQNRLTEVARQEGTSEGVVASKHLYDILTSAVSKRLTGGSTSAKDSI